MIIQTFDYNKYKNKHLNNRKGTNGFQNIFCPQERINTNERGLIY